MGIILLTSSKAFMKMQMKNQQSLKDAFKRLKEKERKPEEQSGTRIRESF